MGGFTSLMSSWTESALVIGVSIVLLGCGISTSFGASLAFSLISLLLSESPFFILFLPEPNNPPTAPPTPSTTFPTLVTGLNGFALSFFSCFALSLDSTGATCTGVGSDGMAIVSVAFLCFLCSFFYRMVVRFQKRLQRLLLLLQLPSYLLHPHFQLHYQLNLLDGSLLVFPFRCVLFRYAFLHLSFPWTHSTRFLYLSFLSLSFPFLFPSFLYSSYRMVIHFQKRLQLHLLLLQLL